MDIKNTFQVYKTLTEILSDRGYILSHEIDYDEFIIMYEENNYDLTDDNKKINVTFFKDIKTFGKKDLETIVQGIKEDFNNNNIKIIIILKDKYNITIEKELTNALYKNVEIFLFKNLTFNITNHEDVPKHIPLTEEEAKEVLNIYKCTNMQIPKILYTDPMARYYGLKPGQMFKIIRTSPSAGEYISYRYVR